MLQRIGSVQHRLIAPAALAAAGSAVGGSIGVLLAVQLGGG